jgi:putative addiction module component (TIGR02574 family)
MKKPPSKPSVGISRLPDVEAAWEKEIKRRLHELRSGKVKGIPLEKVKKGIEMRFSISKLA